MNQQHFATYGHASVPPQQQMYAAARTNSGYGGQFATVGRTASMSIAGALPPISMWTPPSPFEHQYYDVLFAVADEEKRNAIGGRLAVMFFSRSSADKQILREIWNIADAQQRGELSRNEFYVAMRLISMAQRGEAVSVQRFFELAAAPFPLPVLDGVPPPPPQIQQQQQQQTPSPHMTPPHMAVGSGPHPRGPYAVTDEEKTRYDAIFAQYDTDGDGFLLGGEAVGLFQLSGLDRNLLREIWALADRGQDSKLDKREFYVAMHLIVCASKRGLAVPPHLPQELVDSVFGAPHSSFGSGSDVGSSNSNIGGNTSAPHSRTSSLHAGTAHEQSSSSNDADDPFAGLSAAPEATPSPRLGSFSSADQHIAASSPSLPSNAGALEHRSSFQTPNALQQPTPTPPGSARGSFYGAASGHESLPPSSVGVEHAHSSATGSFSNAHGAPSHFEAAGGMMMMMGQQQQQQQHQGAVGPGLHGHGGMMSGYGNAVPMQTAAVQPFLSGDDDVQAVRQLEAQNDEVAKCLAAVETKQRAIESLAEKLRELDQLRHDLVTLSIKRESVRAANSAAASTSSSSASSNTSVNSAQLQAKRAVETSLQDLIASETRAVEQLQHEVTGLEHELQNNGSSNNTAGTVAAAAPPAQSATFAFATEDVGKPLSATSSSASSGFFAPPATTASFGAFGDFDASASTASSAAAPMPSSNPSTLPTAFGDFAAPSPANSTSSTSGFDAFGDFGGVSKPSPSSAPTSSSTFDAFAGFGFS